MASNLKTAMVVGENTPYFSKCDEDHLFGRGCLRAADQGTHIPFYNAVADQLNLTISYIQANAFGTGTLGEQRTAYQLMEDGTADFVGPDYAFLEERQHAVRSLPIAYSRVHMYFSTRFTGTNYNILEFTDGSTFALAGIAALAVYFFHFVYDKHFILSRHMGKGSKLLLFVVINLLLNLFSSRLTAKLTQSREWQPDVDSIEDIVDLVESSSKLVLVRRLPITEILQVRLFERQTANTKRRLKRKLMFVETVELALTYVTEHSDSITLINDFELYVKSWFFVCPKLAEMPLGYNIFKPLPIGFYFSNMTLDRTSSLRDYIGKSRRSLGRFYQHLTKKYLAKSQKYWKCREPRYYVPSVKLANTWNTSLRNLVYGLVAAMGLFVVENIVSSAKLMIIGLLTRACINSYT